FTLDPERFELRRRDRPLSVQPKIFSLLMHLVSHRDRVVTRAELFASVWSGVSVGQSSLNRAVRELRRALGDDEKAPRYVATLPRRGYRFIAAVKGGRAAPDARRRAQSALVRVSAAHSFSELTSALQETGSIVDADATILCRYSEESPIGVSLSGSHAE